MELVRVWVGLLRLLEMHDLTRSEFIVLLQGLCQNGNRVHDRETCIWAQIVLRRIGLLGSGSLGGRGPAGLAGLLGPCLFPALELPALGSGNKLAAAGLY